MMFAYYMNFGEEKVVKSRKNIYKMVFINNCIFLYNDFFSMLPLPEIQVLCDPVFLQLQFPLQF